MANQSCWYLDIGLRIYVTVGSVFCWLIHSICDIHYVFPGQWLYIVLVLLNLKRWRELSRYWSIFKNKWYLHFILNRVWRRGQLRFRGKVLSCGRWLSQGLLDLWLCTATSLNTSVLQQRQENGKSLWISLDMKNTCRLFTPWKTWSIDW